MRILVTGGAGYIGSHTCVELLNAGHQVVVVDNLSNSKPESLRRVGEITGKTCEFHAVDLLDREALAAVFAVAPVDAVIHFAGLKAVGESNRIPLHYYHNNMTGTVVLCQVMAAANCRNLVFSSSATVYGDPASVPIVEGFPLSATNPYGRTKLFIEEMLGDLHRSDPAWNIVLLRYFNPVGAHASGKIGEDPNGIPNNLVPYIAQVAVGRLAELAVFGNDYATPDGTGVRDYIHVVDLAGAHVRAVEHLAAAPGILALNLGTGRGCSVLEMIASFEKASGQSIPYKILPRRTGDVGACYADPTKAREVLGWQARLSIESACADTWRWQCNNPNGFDGPQP